MPQGPESPSLAGSIVVALTQPALDKGFNRTPARYSDHVLQVPSLTFCLVSSPVLSCPARIRKGTAQRQEIGRQQIGSRNLSVLADAGAV